MNKEKFESGINSKERILEFGEVTTGTREINAMLDFVKEESYNINTTFLDPAAGDGNFPLIILERKLSAIKNDYLKKSLIAFSTIYAVEIQEDNVLKMKKRLYQKMIDFFIKHNIQREFNEKVWTRISKFSAVSRQNILNFILLRNIVCKDFLKNEIRFFEYDWKSYPFLLQTNLFHLSKVNLFNINKEGEKKLWILDLNFFRLVR